MELAKGRAPYSHFAPMKVLVLTIEDEPPGLHSYAHDKQLFSDGLPFSAAFLDFYKRCLQKSARNRPTAAELSNHMFLRGSSPNGLVRNLLNRIADVGSDEAPDAKVLVPSEDNKASDATVRTNTFSSGDHLLNKVAISESERDSMGYVPGTTWVFDTGEERPHKNDSIQEFLEDFEHDMASLKPEATSLPIPTDTSTHAFLEEFENCIQDESSKT